MAALEVDQAVAALAVALGAAVVVSVAAARQGDGCHAFKAIIQAWIDHSVPAKSGFSKSHFKRN